MASPSQLVQHAFAAGIDESVRAEVLDPMAGFRVLENVRQATWGAVSKRAGFSTLTLARLGGTTRSAGYRLFAHGKQTCVVDGASVDGYSPALTASVTRGRASEALVTSIRSLGPLDDNSARFYLHDVHVCGGYLFLSSNLNGDIYVDTYDVVTGEPVNAPRTLWTLLSVSSWAGLASYGPYVFAILFETGSANVRYRYLDTTSATTVNNGWVASANAATDGNGDMVGCVESLDGRVALAYRNNSGGASQLTVKTLQTGGVVETATVNTGGVLPGGVALGGTSADTLWVAWTETTNVRVLGLDGESLGSTLASAATIITMTTAISAALPGLCIAPSATAGKARLFVNDGDTLKLRMRGVQTSGGAAATDGSSEQVPYCYMNSRAREVGGRYYALCTYGTQTNAQKTPVLCDVTGLIHSGTLGAIRPVASVKPGLADVLGLSNTSAGSPAAVCQLPLYSSDLIVPLSVAATSYKRSKCVARLSFTDHRRWQKAGFARLAYLAGGIITAFDGDLVCEANYLFRPEKPTTALSGGSLTGTFRYIATFEQVDGAGNIVYSGASDPSDAVAPAAQTVTVSVKPLPITARQRYQTDSFNRVTLWRTLSNGSIYYYLATVANDLSGAVPVTYADTTTDATLATRAKMFRQPGQLGTAQDRRAPPGGTCPTVYNGMLVVAVGDAIWNTAQLVDGEAPWFNPIWQTPIGSDDDITGMAAQDGTLFAFTRTRICALVGEPPSENGASGGFGSPRWLAADVGCTDPNSIVVTEKGIFFQSARGLELLTRGQSVEFVGQKVQSTLASYPIVSSAVLDSVEGVVYFELASSRSSGLVSGTGRTLVYDLTLGAWVSTDRRKKYDGTADTPAQSSAVIFDTASGTYRYAWLDTGGRVYVESTDSLDTGSAARWVTMKAETGWHKTSGIQGRQQLNRVLALAQQSTDHDLSLSVAYDYGSYQTAQTWTAATVDAIVDAIGRIQVGSDAHEDASGCSAFAVKLEDATPSEGTVGTGEGGTWISLTYDVAPQPGPYLLPDIAR